MKTIFSRALLLATLAVTGCFWQSEPAPTMLSMAARNGMRWSYGLLTKGALTPEPPPRPSAMLGPYVAAFLSLPLIETSHTAVSGVLAGAGILFEDQGNRDVAYALLEELGITLQVDVPDHLNRAIDRNLSLDAYREGLIDIATRCQEHVAVLEARQDDVDTKLREVRRHASDTQRSLNEALRAKDYATASNRQAELSEVQGELAIVSSEQKELRNLLNVFDDSLQVAADRLVAIDANREALIAGISVTDLPGAEDLGVLDDTGHRRSKNNAEDIFGPVQPTQ